MMTTQQETSPPQAPQYDLLLDRFSQHVSQQASKKLFSFIGPGLDAGRLQTSYTYAELATETAQASQRLLAAGLKRGDR